jgi:hypothetical protein
MKGSSSLGKQMYVLSQLQKIVLQAYRFGCH